MAQTVPSKMLAYLVSAKPIIAALDGEGSRVVMEPGAGTSCLTEDPQALARAVRVLKATAAAEREQMAERRQRYYEAHFEARTLALQLRAHLGRAVSDRGTGINRKAGGAE